MDSGLGGGSRLWGFIVSLATLSGMEEGSLGGGWGGLSANCRGDEILVQGSGYLSNITSVIDKIRSLIGGGYGKPPYIWWNEGVIGPWGVAKVDTRIAG